jgi:hypothetical protein
MNINSQLLIEDDENHIVLKRKTCKDNVQSYVIPFSILIILLLNIANLIYLIRINYMINIVIPYAPKIQELVDIACTYVNCSNN